VSELVIAQNSTEEEVMAKIESFFKEEDKDE